MCQPVRQTEFPPVRRLKPDRFGEVFHGGESFTTDERDEHGF
jgi:hypothetical protein